MRSWYRKLLGVCCLIVGLAFGVLPLVPGVLLILVGLELLGIPIVPWKKLEMFRRHKEKAADRQDDDHGVS